MAELATEQSRKYDYIRSKAYTFCWNLQSASRTAKTTLTQKHIKQQHLSTSCLTRFATRSLDIDTFIYTYNIRKANLLSLIDLVPCRGGQLVFASVPIRLCCCSAVAIPTSNHRYVVDARVRQT